MSKAPTPWPAHENRSFPPQNWTCFTPKNHSLSFPRVWHLAQHPAASASRPGRAFLVLTARPVPVCQILFQGVWRFRPLSEVFPGLPGFISSIATIGGSPGTSTDPAVLVTPRPHPQSAHYTRKISHFNTRTHRLVHPKHPRPHHPRACHCRQHHTISLNHPGSAWAVSSARAVSGGAFRA